MSQSAPTPTTRLSPWRVGFVLLLVLAPLMWFGYSWASTTTQSVAARTSGTGFAGYVDVTLVPTYHFESPVSPAANDVILAFIVADKDDSCEPTWGTFYTLDTAASDLDLDRRIEQLRIVGGNVRVSFGGAFNDELSVVCTDDDKLRDAYLKVIDRYKLQSIDLDIEGAALSDEEGNARRGRAIKSVQEAEAAQGRKLDVWLTLPTDTNGLTEIGRKALAATLAAGVDLSGVNAMAMNFGGSKLETEDMSNAAEKAGLRLQRQIKDAYADIGEPLSEEEAWFKVGVTPMIGQNDITTEKFTIGDAKSLNAWALEKGIGLLSMWSLNRDSTCGPPLPMISNVTHNTCSGVDQKDAKFADTLSANTVVPALPQENPLEPTPTPSPTFVAPSPAISGSDLVDDPDKSPYPIWDPATPYPVDTKVVWKQQVYQAKRWSTGFAPDTQVSRPEETPWRLIGPVAAEGEKPAPLPSVPPGSYPEWQPGKEYPAGSRIQFQNVPYVAKWWNENKQPDPEGGTKHPWAVARD